MEMSDYSHMVINLNDLIQPLDNLDHLEMSFTKEEIDETVSSLPNNKSPGHDDYTNEFLKGCWPLVHTDFYKLFDAFSVVNSA